MQKHSKHLQDIPFKFMDNAFAFTCEVPLLEGTTETKQDFIVYGDTETIGNHLFELMKRHPAAASIILFASNTFLLDSIVSGTPTRLGNQEPLETKQHA